MPGEPGYNQTMRFAEDTIQQQITLKRVTECAAKKHFPGTLVFSCGHCVDQDEVHPIGIVRTPKLYYLCKACYDKHTTRKLDLLRALQTSCWNCIMEECLRIKKIDPTKVVDMTIKT
jgi:hypothetical protein